jgi:lauroyl/myristoyl acyltransferase
LLFRLWQVITAVVKRLPRRAAYGVAWVAGMLGYYFWPSARRAMHQNFERVLADAHPREIRRVARSSVVNYCKYLADFMRFPALHPEFIVESVRGSESFQQLDGALAEGRGALMVCMHVGNWDMAAGAAAARGYPVTVIAESFEDPRLDSLVVGARRRLGMNVVKLERLTPSLYRSLRNNGVLALLIDRPACRDGVRVQFFGQELEVPAGAARLALRTGAKLVPAAFVRTRPFAPEITVLTDFSIEPPAEGDEGAKVAALMQAVMNAHERFIRQHPDQWYMFRELWPQMPANASRGMA